MTTACQRRPCSKPTFHARLDDSVHGEVVGRRRKTPGHTPQQTVTRALGKVTEGQQHALEVVREHACFDAVLPKNPDRLLNRESASESACARGST